MTVTVSWGHDDETAAGLWDAASAAALGVGSRLRASAAQLEEIRRQALSVCRLNWESPAGERFVAYLEDHTAAIAVSVTLLSTAARLAEAHAESLRRSAGEASGSGLGP